MKYNIGIDLGGTNIKVGLVDENYNIVSKATCKTDLPRPAEEIADSIADTVWKALNEAKVTIDELNSIGIGTPGTASRNTGVVLYSCNLGFKDTDLRSLVGARLGKEVYVENDANAAAFGEVLAGAGKGYHDVVVVTLGTGVGGGIIIDGKIYAGMRSMGAELGHTLLVLEGEHCTCGRDGCWEAYASATALIRQAKRAGEQHPDSVLHGREELTARDVFEAADGGDAAAQAVIDRWCVYVAAGLTDLVNSLAPEMILIGGGVSRQGERILAPIREYVAEHCFGQRQGAIPVIAAAKLGNEAGIIGAAAL